jgi:hypothetical protein
VAPENGTRRRHIRLARSSCNEFPLSIMDELIYRRHEPLRGAKTGADTYFYMAPINTQLTYCIFTLPWGVASIQTLSFEKAFECIHGNLFATVLMGKRVNRTKLYNLQLPPANRCFKANILTYNSPYLFFGNRACL